ncbi:MAG: response regulator [Sandaracinus sp.]|jgi:two-component system chemotaxis response regulator CheY
MLDRVLVVDDSNAIRAFVRASLEGSGRARTVVEAASGFEALRMLPRERFDAAIVDINMPDIHGLEVIKLIRASKAHQGVPVLAISSEGASKDRERALALGADAWLDKPFTPELLARSIDDVVERRARVPSSEGGP